MKYRVLFMDDHIIKFAHMFSAVKLFNISSFKIIRFKFAISFLVCFSNELFLIKRDNYKKINELYKFLNKIIV